MKKEYDEATELILNGEDLNVAPLNWNSINKKR